MNYAPKLPLSRGNQENFKMITDIKELIRFHMKNLLLTSPGEKISDPLYGVGLKTYLFEPLHEGTYNIIRNRINAQMRKYIDYITIRKIDFSSDADDTFLGIGISYEISNTNISDVLNVNVSSNNNSSTVAF